MYNTAMTLHLYSLCALAGGRDIHGYETTSELRDTVVYEHLLSQAGAHFTNRHQREFNEALKLLTS